MNSNKDISSEELERIERFLTQQMPASEESDFRVALANDGTLREKTDEIRLLLAGIGEHSLESQLDQFHGELTNDQSENRKSATIIPLGRRLLVAASLLAIITLGAWFLFFQENRNDKLYGKFYSPDPGLPTVMGTSANYNFDKAMVEYKNGQFAEALTAWTAQLATSPSNDTLTYFIGVAQQASNAGDAGTGNLEKVANDTASAFRKDACWYLGLSYLKKGNRTKAIEFIERSEHPQRTAILEAIK